MALPERFEKIKTLLAKRQPDLTVLMESLQKPYNLAAIMRNADAVGIHDVHAVRINPQAQHIGMSKFYSSGAREWVHLHTYPRLADGLAAVQAQGMQIVAAHFSDRAVDYREIDYCQPTAILTGAEKFGVSAEAADIADQHTVIPMMGFTQSLNVSVAAALILFEAQRQRSAAGLYDTMRLPADEYKKRLFEAAHPKIRQYCIERNRPYPEMDIETGELLSDPRQA